MRNLLYHGGGIFLPFFCLIFLIPGSSKSFSMTMLDVGQGECIFLHTATGKNILIDGGSTSVSNVGQYRILPFLKSQAIRTVDYVIVTHGDEDHVSGLEEILSKEDGGIAVRYLILPDVADKEQEEYAALAELAGKNHIPVGYISDGWRLAEGEMTISCLNPVSGFSSDSANAESVTLSLLYRGLSCLLTGDLEKEGEDHVEELLRTSRKNYGAPEEYTILKVAHHGSKNSTSREFLEQVSPRFALISCGKNNRYGHPHGDLLERLQETDTQVMRTDEMGAVQICISGKTGEILFRKYLNDKHISLCYNGNIFG
jgi:competence protein ComEC